MRDRELRLALFERRVISNPNYIGNNSGLLEQVGNLERRMNSAEFNAKYIGERLDRLEQKVELLLKSQGLRYSEEGHLVRKEQQPWESSIE